LKREIREIAKEISQKWTKVHFAAKPYLEAMFSLRTMNDKFYLDDAKSIILYFLSNASSFRGEDAKRLKADLKEVAGIK